MEKKNSGKEGIKIKEPRKVLWLCKRLAFILYFGSKTEQLVARYNVLDESWPTILWFAKAHSIKPVNYKNSVEI